jgi:hypothetical protein
MNIWVVYFRGEPEYASTDYYDAWDRYMDLYRGFGPDDVEFKLEHREF